LRKQKAGKNSKIARRKGGKERKNTVEKGRTIFKNLKKETAETGFSCGEGGTGKSDSDGMAGKWRTGKKKS